MTESNNLDVNKKLSKHEALREYDELFREQAANIIEAYRNMDRLLDLLKSAGYSQSEAITKMSEDAKKIGLRGFSEASIRYKLSDESKKQTKPGPRKSNRTVTFQQVNRRLVVPEEPTIPPPPEVVREAEIVREPPKPIEEPIKIQSKIIEFIFAPKTIDMVDTSQAFLIQLDITTGTVKNYKTVGRRTRLS